MLSTSEKAVSALLDRGRRRAVARSGTFKCVGAGCVLCVLSSVYPAVL